MQFEFTGRHTNVILLDENEIIIEALRHIDADSSFRVIRPSVKLLAIPSLKRDESAVEIKNIEEYLKERYLKFEAKRVDALKRQKLLIVSKREKKLQNYSIDYQIPKI